MAKLRKREPKVKTINLRADILDVNHSSSTSDLVLVVVEGRNDGPNLQAKVKLQFTEIPRLAELLHKHIDRQQDMVNEARSAMKEWVKG